MSIKHWAKDDKPREKLIDKGVGSLSNSELLAILISTGTRVGTTSLTALDLARAVLELTENNLVKLGTLTLADLCKVRGVGHAKAVTILATLELCRRRRLEETTSGEDKGVFRCSTAIVDYCMSMLQDKKVEEIWILLLNNAAKMLGKELLSVGGTDAVVVDIKLLVKKAIDLSATMVVLVHNHPSGNITPSSEDKLLTSKVKQALSFMDIHLVDHIIISGANYFSFRDSGTL